MDVYTFYSEFNDKWNRSIPQEVRDAVEYEGKQIPKKYRSYYDIFISGIDEFSPSMYGYDSAHIWYSDRNRWVLHFYRNGDVKNICPNKYVETIKKLDSFPSYIPIWPLRIIIMLGWMADNDDIDGITRIMDEYNISVNDGKSGW